MQKNTFTAAQEAQIRKALDRLMNCGTAHISLCDCTPEDAPGEYITWYKVRAVMPYTLQDTITGDVYEDDKRYEISVGVFPDRRRHILTALDMSQHDR